MLHGSASQVCPARAPGRQSAPWRAL